jgi:WD40 repeat protein
MMDNSNNKEKYEYDAFISYSREDEAFAEKLEKALENYKPPKDLNVPQRNLNIFRDIGDMTGSEYYESIDKHLSNSAKLIVICSPSARESDYVNDEIRRFTKLNCAENIIPILLSGIPNNEAKEGQEPKKAFPDSLCEVMQMPLATSYKEFNTKRDKINKGIFEGCWYSILANLYNLSREEIEQRDKRRQLRQRRLRATIVSAIMLSLAVLTVIAFWQRTVAVKQRNIAQANYLIVLAQQQVEKDPTSALRLAEAASKFYRTPDFRESTYKIYRENVFYKTIAQHKESVRSVAFSPDGINVLTGSLDSTACLWCLSGKKLATFEEPNQIVSVAFSPDGKTILTAAGHTACIRDLTGQKLARLEGHETHVTSAVFSPDGKYVMTGSTDETIRLWDIFGNCIEVYKPEPLSELWSVAFSRDCKMLLAGSTIGVHLWDLEKDKMEFIKGFDKFGRGANSDRDVAFSPDGSRFLFSMEYRAVLTDSSARLVQEFQDPYGAGINSVAFSPNGKYGLTDSKGNSALLWDLSGKILMELKGHTDEIEEAVFSPDGRLVLTASADHTVRLWDLTDVILREFKCHGERISTLAVSPNNEAFLTGSADSTARLWDISGNLLHVYKGHEDLVFSVKFSPGGEHILTGSFDDTAKLWDVSGNEIRTYRGHTGDVLSVAFSPNGKYILTGSRDGTARMWEIHGNTIKILKGHEEEVHSVDFCLVDETFLTSSEDGLIQLWNYDGDLLDTVEFKVKSKFGDYYLKPLLRETIFSPDGKYILARSWKNDIIELFDLKTGTSIITIHPENAPDAVTFSMDGKIIIAANIDDVIQAWDLSGNELQSFNIGKRILSLACLNDSRHVIGSSYDGTVTLWRHRMPLEDFLERGTLDRLTTEQKRQYGIPYQ